MAWSTMIVQASYARRLARSYYGSPASTRPLATVPRPHSAGPPPVGGRGWSKRALGAPITMAPAACGRSDRSTTPHTNRRGAAISARSLRSGASRQGPH